MEINWANILIFCGLSIGHVAFVVAIVNRVHGLRLPLPLLHRLRQFHDLVIVIFPALFVWFYGVHGPALFRVAGPVWHRLPTAVLAYLAVCGVIAISLPLIAVYRVLRNPSNRISLQS